MSFTEEHSWKVLEAYAKKNSLVINQIESYNHFVQFGLQEIIDQESTISLPNYKINFTHVSLSPPQIIEEDRSLKLLYPMDARLRDINYDSAILCDIIESYEENGTVEVKKHRKIVIGRMPVMVKSSVCNLSSLNDEECVKKGECPNDTGGYFVIKGNERVLVGQLRGTYNEVFVYKQKSGKKWSIKAETRSMSDETGHSVLLQAMIGTDDRTVSFSLPYIKQTIPVGIVFKALGFCDEKDILNFINLNCEKGFKYLRYIVRDSFFCQTQKEALEYIGKFSLHVIETDKRKDYAWQIVENETLPHLGISGSLKEQAFFLGRMIRKLINTHIGERSEDDKDNYANKRVDTAGRLMYDIFRNLFKKYIQFIKLKIEKRKQRPDIISTIATIKNITQGLHKCLATGNWGIQKNATYIRTGVSQVLDRMTYCATLSHLRRVLIPMGKEGKNSAMRQIHSSSYGFICPCECFDPSTEILMWNGTVKKAKEIKVDDYLIDSRGRKTRVKSVCTGLNEMFQIKHANENFKDYIVTENHILTLYSVLHKKIYKKEDQFIIAILNKENFSYKYIIFQTEKEALDYKNTISTDSIIDISIRTYLKLPDLVKNTFKTFKSFGVYWDMKNVEMDPYTLGKKLGEKFLLKKELTIPKDYLINDYDTRFKLLEGLSLNIDIQNEKVKDLTFLLQSLGVNKFSFSDFTLVKKPINPFVGWQVEGDGRFLLGDFTITHNTPEGQKIGVVLNYSLLTKITKKVSKVDTRNVLEKIKSIIKPSEVNLNESKNYSNVLLNGMIIGFSDDPEKTVSDIKKKRDKGYLDMEVSVSYDSVDDDIRVFCDEGRFTRPLLTATENKLNIQPEEKYKWNRLIKKSLVRYVDVSEIENSVIAMTPDYFNFRHNDFCEIHPSTMLGIMASMIPFPDHSQSPRNCYQSSMGKQALGIPILSYNLRTDTILHVLNYPQRPLVCTKAADLFNINDMPSGINAIVAIACYSGFNQEDSLMLNLSSIQKGLFCLTSYHSIDCFEKKRDTYSFEEICLPPLSSESNVSENSPMYFKRKNANYSLLDENGIIRPRERFENGKWVGAATVVKKGDVLVGKVVVSGSKSAEETKIDASVVVQPGEEGIIDRVFTTITPNGYKLVKIVLRVYREPTLGDKLASRAAQKGTVGMVYRTEDMPFSSSGIVPDIIINALCIPSRMTINQLIETALGKECAVFGKYGDCTPFTENSINAADKLVERISKKITEYGHQPQGWERLYNGMTGEMIESQIFMGPTYYQRLKHMVDDKMHARAHGHVTSLTRQPTEGRSREGGLRFGEMERDAMISHGNSAMILERLFSVSDPFQICVCDNCGIITSKKTECQNCKSDSVSECNMPYASKLLHQELTAMGLKINIKSDKF